MSNLWIDITSDDTVNLHRPNDKGRVHQDMRITLTQEEAIRMHDYIGAWLSRKGHLLSRQESVGKPVDK